MGPKYHGKDWVTGAQASTNPIDMGYKKPWAPHWILNRSCLYRASFNKNFTFNWHMDVNSMLKESIKNISFLLTRVVISLKKGPGLIIISYSYGDEGSKLHWEYFLENNTNTKLIGTSSQPFSQWALKHLNFEKTFWLGPCLNKNQEYFPRNFLNKQFNQFQYCD